MRRGCWKGVGLLLVFVLACRFGYRLYTGRIPLTNLPVTAAPLREEDLQALHQIWPGNPDMGVTFDPVPSPNGQYSIDIRGWLGRSVLVVYKNPGVDIIGFYSFKRLIIYQWAEDSSGVYIADYTPGGDTLLWDVGPVFPPAYQSPIKKVLVPCMAVDEAPWWQWQRWYWEMRCLFADPHSPLAVWLPLMLLVVGLGAAGWGTLRWLRSSQGRSVMPRLARMVLDIPRRIEDWLLGI